MSKSVFISHAGADSPKAAAVAALLNQAAIEVRFDRRELLLGDSFLAFMESALSTADYCLLLWSLQAAATPWVQMEWEAALYRSVQEKRGFLVIARLEETPVPALLGPRLRVDLFPELTNGVAQVIATWQADRAAEKQTQRQVGSAAIPLNPHPGSATIYVTSEQFGITVPLDADLGTPAGVYLDRIINEFKLPRSLDYQGRLGVRIEYRLMNGDEDLERGVSLGGQEVKDKSVLWLETTMTPYSQAAPVSGALGAAVFRGPRSPAEEQEYARAASFARQEYLTTLLRNGLGA